MNQQERLTNLINNFGEQLLEWLKDGSVFVKDQAPLICQEIVRFGQAQYALFCALGVFLTLISIAMLLFAHKKLKRPWPDDFVLTSIFSIIGIIGGIVVITCNLYYLLMTIYAPRLYLIQELKEFIK